MISLNILALPENARAAILRLLDKQTILEMREVCKKAKRFANFAIVSTQKTIFVEFRCEEQLDDSAVLTFGFENLGMCCIWKNVFNYFTEWLGIPGFNVHELSKNCNLIYSLSVTMASGEAEIFFDYAKTHMRNAEFHEFSLTNCSEKYNRICSIFLEEKSIGTVRIICKKYDFNDFDAHLHILAKFKPKSFRFVLNELSEDCFGWLIQVSKIVTRLTIQVRTSISSKLNPVAIIRALRDSKFRTLHIILISNIYLSFEEIENMIQILLSTIKKVFIMSRSHEEPIHAQFGQYQVTTTGGRNDISRFIAIKHIDLP